MVLMLLSSKENVMNKQAAEELPSNTNAKILDE